MIDKYNLEQLNLIDELPYSLESQSIYLQTTGDIGDDEGSFAYISIKERLFDLELTFCRMTDSEGNLTFGIHDSYDDFQDLEDTFYSKLKNTYSLSNDQIEHLEYEGFIYNKYLNKIANSDFIEKAFENEVDDLKVKHNLEDCCRIENISKDTVKSLLEKHSISNDDKPTRKNGIRRKL